MKKAVLIIIVAALLVISCVILFLSPSGGIKTADVIQAGVIVIVAGLAIFIGVRKLEGVRRGEPAEDELSKKLMVRASSVSFYISIYLWLLIMYLSEKTKLAVHTLIGAGIAGMALILVICWIILYLRGIRNE